MGGVLRLYAGDARLVADRRYEYMPLLYPFAAYSLDERVARYGDWIADVEVTERVIDADLVVLPFPWNHYVGDRSPAARALVATARNHACPVISAVLGDHGVDVPTDMADVYVFRPGGFRSRSSARTFGLPVQFGDPVSRFGFGSVRPRQKQTVPRVGFCGLASRSAWGNALDVARTVAQNVAHVIHLQRESRDELYPPVLRRTRILHALERTPGVECAFRPQRAYRGGARTTEERDRTTRQFYDNVHDTDYTVCVRGGGNFSVRLYETLAMGRIPLYVHTDDLLPWTDRVDWRDAVVWIDSRDVDHVGEILLDVHARMTSDEFEARQLLCRKLWERHCSYEGFFRSVMQCALGRELGVPVATRKRSELAEVFK